MMIMIMIMTNNDNDNDNDNDSDSDGDSDNNSNSNSNNNNSNNNNNRDLNRIVLHLWSKFGDPSLNGWWDNVRTRKWLLHTHGQTHRRRRWQYSKAKNGLG